MFGKYRRRTSSTSDASRAKPPVARTGAPLPDADFSSPGAPGAATRRLATYDQLGQTLVATLTVGTLSGPEAMDLATELYKRIHASHTDAEATTPGVRHIVLDLQNVQYMDSMCVGVLVELLTKLNGAGGRIALVNAAHNVEYLFKLTRLDRVFPICRDVMKAIEMVERGG